MSLLMSGWFWSLNSSRLMSVVMLNHFSMKGNMPEMRKATSNPLNNPQPELKMMARSFTPPVKRPSPQITRT